MEIKINVELGITPAMEKFAATLMAINNTHHFGVTPEHTVIERSAPEPEAPAKEEPVKTEKPKRASRAKKEDTAPAPTAVEGEPKPEPETPAKPEPAKEEEAAITLPDLRQVIARVWDGGKHKTVTDGVLAEYGAKNLIDLPKDKYKEVYNRLVNEALKLGL